MKLKECLAKSPVLSDDGNQINEVHVRFMAATTIGFTCKELGLSKHDNRKEYERLEKAGVEFPTYSKWWATQTERKVLYIIGEGARNIFEVSKELDSSTDVVRVHMSNMRKTKRGINVPKLERSPKRTFNQR